MENNVNNPAAAGLALTEQKNAMLSAIIASSDDTIISKTLDGIIVSWNPAANKMFGYSEAEAIGQHISLIIPQDRLDEEHFIIGEIRQGRKIDHLETVRKARDGRLVPISLSVSPIVDADGKVIGASKIARDVSDRKLADEKQAVLAAIIGSSDDAIISKTLQGIITSWNTAAERLFGYSEAEAIGQHISLIIPPELLIEEDMIIANITQGKKIDHFETTRSTKDGRRVPISVTVSPIVDAQGNIIGASKIARDISEQRYAAEKKGILAAIVNTSDDTIVSKTLEGIITSWNKAAEKMFGYTEAEALGQHISLIIPPERLNEESYIIGEITKGNKIDHFHTFRLAKDGHQIPISVSVSPVVDNHGKVIGASKIARDISEQLSMQAEKARLYDQVKALNDKKDEFIGLASHELKTPLTSISGYLHILSKLVKEEKGQQFLEKTMLQVKKLRSLVNDLLDVSKIETGKLPLSIERFDIRQVVDDTLELIAHSYPQFRFNLHTEVSELFISGDPNRIEQVLLNLLTNAARYSPGTDQIELFLVRKAESVVLGIKDQGVGIAADKLPHIFSRFYRVDEANPNTSGLGIGLYLSQEVVTRHGGRIWAESEPGQGSTFWFSLPVRATDMPDELSL